MDAKDEIKARLAIEDVIGEYVELKRAGRNFKGLSPFTGEKTASFMVSPDKQIWHDFSSNKGGDMFSFVMAVEGLEFRPALELLARKAGVDLSLYQSAKAGQAAKKREKLREIVQLAQRYYQQQLVKNRMAQEYVFQTRGLDKKVVVAFAIGYAPSQDALVTILKRRGYDMASIRAAGLTNRFGGDLFRDRMMVPLMDGSGITIGFTGRIVGAADASAPKYLNTPQTLLYDKSRHVFGLSQAKEAIRTHDEVVIVEGNLDVVSSHQAGVKHVVATAGTAMTEHHLKALGRLASRIKLAFDGDKAGLAATERAIELSQTVDIDLEVVTLPSEYKDPDEAIQADVNKWTDAIAAARPAVEWVMEQYRQREDMSGARGKRQFTDAALKMIKQLKDAVEQEHYLQRIAQETDISEAVLRQKMQQLGTQQTAAPKKPIKSETVPTQAPQSNELVLALAIAAPSARPQLSALSDDTWHSEQSRQLAHYLVNHPEEVMHDTPEDLQDIDQYVKILTLQSDTRYASMDEPAKRDEMARLIKQTITKHRKQQKDILIRRLRDAEAADDESAAQDLRQQLNELIRR